VIIKPRPTTGVLKTCTKCKKPKDTSQFNVNGRCKDGIDSWCYVCKAALSKQYYWDNVETQRAKAKKYGQEHKEEIYARNVKHPDLYLWIHLKSRAKAFGLKFTLKPEDIVVPKLCPVLGIKLRLSKGTVKDCSPTVDKLIPSKGYVPGNVAVISQRANRAKSDLSLKELKALTKWLEKTLKGKA
jgi:hypothetical protein